MVRKTLTDPETIQRLMSAARSHNEATTIKNQAEKEGYNYQVSLYGVVRQPDDTHQYRRIEVLLNGLPTERSMADIYNFFHTYKPFEYYSLWLYDTELRALCQKGGW